MSDKTLQQPALSAAAEPAASSSPSSSSSMPPAPSKAPAFLPTGHTAGSAKTLPESAGTALAIPHPTAAADTLPSPLSVLKQQLENAPQAVPTTSGSPSLAPNVGGGGGSAARIPTRVLLWRWLWMVLPLWAIIIVICLWLWEFYTVSIVRKTREGITEMLQLEVDLALRSVQNLASDLLVIADAQELAQMEGTPEQQDIAIESLKRDFVSLGNHKRFYDQLRFIDNKGMELVRVNFERSKPRIVPDGELQSKAGRYFVNDTLKLKPGEIYITPLDLSIEWGRIELVDGQYKPMIRLCVPLFQKSEISKPEPKPYGMLTLSYLPEKNMLSEIRKLAAPSPGSLMMLNEDSYWLVAPSPNLEWGFMSKELKAVGIDRKDIKFSDIHPEAWKKIKASDSGSFTTDAGYFVFATVSPLEALKKLNPELKYKSYSWKFVNFIDKAELAQILAPRWTAVYGGITAMLVTTIVGFFLTRSRLQKELAEATLKEQQQAAAKLALVASRTDNAVIILDDKMKIDWVNDGFTRMTGHTMSEVKGLSMSDILHGPETSRKGIIEIVAELERCVPLQAEILLHTKEGFPLWIFMDGQPAYDDAGNFSNYIIVNADVTSQKLAEEEALIARQNAESANQAKSEFLANMSHELRTPMNAILGFSDLLGGMVVESKQKSYLQAIASSGRSLLTLINDILDLSKIEAGKLELQYEPSSLRQLLNEVKQIFYAKAAEKSLELTVDIQDDAPSGLMLDEVRVRQILFNVIGNSLKFTEKGGITISARTTYKEEDETKVDLLLEVTDTGIGIPEDQVDRIFQAFTQVSGQSTRKYGGTGLGLSITRRLTEMMGGKISVRSKYGQGSTFSFFFPNVTVTAYQDTSRADAFASRVDQFKPAVIVVADDVDLNRLLIAGYFEGSKHTLLMAQNGREAVDLTLEHKPDIILMDVRMPEMDGVQASILIRAEPSTKHIPIIAVTASVLKHQEDEVREVVDGFLAKPVSKKDLVDMMRKYLPLQEMDAETEAEARALAEGQSAAVGTSPDVADGDPELWKELLEHLQDAEKNTYPALVQNQKMGEIEDFSALLTTWGNDYKAPALTKYAEHLLEQVQLFDLDGMAHTLEQFPSQVATVATFLTRHAGGEGGDGEDGKPPGDPSPSPASVIDKAEPVPYAPAVSPSPALPASPAPAPSTKAPCPQSAVAAESAPGDSTTAKPSAPTSEAAAEWAGLIYQLRGHLADTWPALVKSQMLGEIEAFGKTLKDLGADFKATDLSTYGAQLISQAEDFDLDTLPGTLEKFPAVIEKLAEEYTAATDKHAPAPGAIPPLSEATATRVTPAGKSAPAPTHTPAAAVSWKALLPHLTELRDHQYKLLCESQLMGEIESFAGDLAALAEQHKCLRLKEYAEQLREAADLFDVELISSRLERFPKLIQELEGTG